MYYEVKSQRLENNKFQFTATILKYEKVQICIVFDYDYDGREMKINGTFVDSQFAHAVAKNVEDTAQRDFMFHAAALELAAKAAADGFEQIVETEELTLADKEPYFECDIDDINELPTYVVYLYSRTVE